MIFLDLERQCSLKRVVVTNYNGHDTKKGISSIFALSLALH